LGWKVPAGLVEKAIMEFDWVYKSCLSPTSFHISFQTQPTLLLLDTNLIEFIDILLVYYTSFKENQG
jgi:hypothetical protein